MTLISDLTTTLPYSTSTPTTTPLTLRNFNPHPNSEMSRNFLNQDLGSEDEDDDFNPAPEMESENEADEKVGICGTPAG